MELASGHKYEDTPPGGPMPPEHSLWIRFLGLVTPEDIDRAFTYSVPVVASDYFKPVTISERQKRKFGPLKVNPSAVVAELERLNSPELWEVIVDQVSEKDEDVVGELMTEMMTSDLSYLIAKHNGKFYGNVLSHASYISVYGDEYPTVWPIVDTDFAGETALTLAAEFNGIVQTPQECIQRLKIIFGPTSDSPDPKLFQMVAQNKDFTVGTGSIVYASCPAPTVTKMLFQRYYQALINPSYTASLATRIAKDS